MFFHFFQYYIRDKCVYISLKIIQTSNKPQNYLDFKYVSELFRLQIMRQEMRQNLDCRFSFWRHKQWPMKAITDGRKRLQESCQDFLKPVQLYLSFTFHGVFSKILGFFYSVPYDILKVELNTLYKHQRKLNVRVKFAYFLICGGLNLYKVLTC